MAKRRGVYHRRKHGLTGLFPTGKEEYICLSFVDEKEEVLGRMVMCNESLVTKATLWQCVNEALEATNIEPQFSLINKKQYLFLDAMDRLSSNGLSAYINISTAEQFQSALDSLVEVYTQVKEAEVILNPEGEAEQLTFVVDENGNLVPLQQPSDMKEFIPQSEEEISMMYQ